MILSTKGRYGLRAMFVLAQNYGKGTMPLTQIAEIESISSNYLEQLFISLRRDQLIKSVRGVRGGYMLSEHPSMITVGKILKALEGPILASNCVDESTTDCDNIDYCVTRLIWNKITKSVDDIIESITLQDMLNDNAKLERAKHTYNIEDIEEVK